MDSEMCGATVEAMASPITGFENPEAVDDRRQQAANRIEVRVGKGCATLQALESDWRMLSAMLPHASFIHSFDWHWAWLAHLEPDAAAIHYVSLYDEGQAIAIFPLRRLRRSVGNIKLWMWELPTHPHLVLCDPLLAPQWPANILLRLLVKLLNQQTKLPWDALHLPNLLGDSVVMRSRLAATLRWTHQIKIGQSMYFECGSLDSALADCSGSFKRNLRRQGKKLALQGQVTLTLARSGGELEAAFAEFLRLEASGWKGGKGKSSAIALHPHVLGFYTELKTRFSAADDCLISLLKLDGVAIAAQFCLFAGDTLYIQKIAYDEAWHAEAPGSQLLYRLIEYACRDTHIKRLSLVTGPAWAVGRWNPQAQDVWEVHVFKPSLGGLCGLAMWRLKQHVWVPARSRYMRRRGAKPISGDAS
jgi:CelD/BcsL family acetyltransferase involved in cellulose biosynthesis